ncbi:FAD/NAD(P)-binding protein [Halococcus sp. IIIV-5B]|uniref:FAD/NAD(P)-binding protein n=1 Tax=Halococcus sp. IIIV-5B TaxID=2321230 RepID=UPI000E7452A8|nr:FAD/NAD(P)-binding protein [Halococcus sp. IIIV-5B]RJT07843.1 thioredoxin reductase [Halococcus sp. IIIV-5B]
MYDYVIIGGGIHGTYVANCLLSDAGYSHSDIRIVEPRAELLDSFASKARRCGMESLRSPFVHHIDTEPFSLRSFVEGAERDGELVPTTSHPNRPTLDVFLDHARDTIERGHIERCHVRARANGITERHGALEVETGEGEFATRNVVLAIGPGGGRTRPEWTESLPDGAPVVHVWDDAFDSAETAVDGRTVVVGGGITAAQVCCRLAGSADVMLLSRHPLENTLTEADPRWMNWDHIEKEIHPLPAGSQARYNRIRAARNDATIPPYVGERLVAGRERGEIDVLIGEIACTSPTDDGLLVRLRDGTAMTVGQVVLATRFDPAPEHPLVSAVAQSLSLERGTNRFPVLDDHTLAWRRRDSTNSNVYISGALAEPTVGPFARNIIGARRAAERLLA